jgi:hypothetical protein
MPTLSGNNFRQIVEENYPGATRLRMKSEIRTKDKAAKRLIDQRQRKLSQLEVIPSL